MKYRQMQFIIVITLLFAFALQGCQADIASKIKEELTVPAPASTASPAATPKLSHKPSPKPAPMEASAEDVFTAFLAAQQLGETGLFALPYSFGYPYGDDYAMVMPGALVLEDAIYSAQIEDIDADGEAELVTVRNAAVPDAYAGELHEALFVDVYEMQNGRAVLADTVQLGASAIPTSAFRGFTDVFMKETRTGWYIGRDSYNSAHYYTDGIGWNILLYRYNGTSLQTVYENEWVGSDPGSDYEHIQEGFSELMTLDLFPSEMLPYMVDGGEESAINHHRITVDGADIRVLLRIESWDVYGGRALFDHFLGIEPSADNSWGLFYDTVERSEQKNQILLKDDLCLVSDESALHRYIAKESRMVTSN